MDIALDLNEKNTTIRPSSISYNIEITVDLSSLEEYIKSNEKSNRIFVETNLEIPIRINNEEKTSTINLINYYNIGDIINNQITQYGYYEGEYDGTREITKTSNFFIYTIG